jgi:hypothetical protein
VYQKGTIILVVLLTCAFFLGCNLAGDTGDSDLFFATEITATGVLNVGDGGGVDGVNGNTPEFYPMSGGAGEPYVVEFTAADEDFVDFSAMPSFMNGGSWAIIEKVKTPAGATVGWHFFRGKGWEDKVGDVAIQLNSGVDSGQVYAWVCSAVIGTMGSWTSVQMDKNDVPGLEILDDTWYTICLQYNVDEEKLQLYVNGSFIAEVASFGAIDDSANTNKLFFGGQDVDPSKSKGDLYTETDCVIAHQAWIQRALTPAEISAYDGTF